MHTRGHRGTGHAAILGGLFLCLVANAQTIGEEEEVAPEDEAIDEIVVVVNRHGDPVLDFDMRYEEILRKKILDEYFRLQALEEDAEWRRADPDLDLDGKNSSRIKWGYNPQAEMRMRRESDFMDLPVDNVKPATVFRVEF